MDDLAAYPAAFAVYRRHRVPFSPSTTQHISFPIPDALPLAYLLRQLVNTCCRPPPQCRNDSRAAPAPEPPGVYLYFRPNRNATKRARPLLVGRARVFTEPKALAAGTAGYSRIFVTTPEPTVRPPSRIAKRRPSSHAIGVINVISMSMLSPGMTISTPSGSLMLPVTSVVRK